MSTRNRMQNQTLASQAKQQDPYRDVAPRDKRQPRCQRPATRWLGYAIHLNNHRSAWLGRDAQRSMR